MQNKSTSDKLHLLEVVLINPFGLAVLVLSALSVIDCY